MTRILSGGGVDASSNPTQQVVGRPGFQKKNTKPRQSATVLKKTDPADAVLTQPLSDVPLVGGRKAVYTTAMTGEDNDLRITAVDEGTGGNDISIELIDPDADSQDISVAVTTKAIAVTLGSDAGAASTYSTNLTGATHNDLTFTAKEAGSDGDDISIEYADPGVADQTLSVEVTDGAIKVNLATGADPEKAVTTTAADVKAAIDEDDDASALVTVANKTGNNGTGLVADMSAQNLAGGGVGYLLSTAREVMDAINGDDDASALVSVALYPAGASGAGRVIEISPHVHLAGGKVGEMRDALPPALSPGPSSPGTVKARKQTTPSASGVESQRFGDVRVVNRSTNRRLRKR